MNVRLAALLVVALLAGPAAAVAPVLAADTATQTGQPATTSLQTTAVPTGFRALSVTFASASEGWVLGTIPCGSTRCLSVAHTVNAGHTWSRLPAPPTSINPMLGLNGDATGVAAIRFANAHDGWAFGPELWATHDGGHHWTQIHVTGLSTGWVVALEAGNGKANAVFYDGATHLRIATAPDASNTWTRVSTSLLIGAGPIPEVQLVLSGASGWILQNDRVVVNGARLISGVWHTWNPVCGSVVGPAWLAASSATNLAAVCDVGTFSTPAGTRVYTSHNGGFSFVRVGPRLPLLNSLAIASPSTSTMIVAGQTSSGARLLGSFNGGVTWTTVRTLGDVSVADLGFTTLSQGVVVTSNGRLYMTRNGGHSWSSVTF